MKTLYVARTQAGDGHPAPSDPRRYQVRIYSSHAGAYLLAGRPARVTLGAAISEAVRLRRDGALVTIAETDNATIGRFASRCIPETTP